MFGFFSIYVDDPSFTPDDGMVSRVLKLLVDHGLIEVEMKVRDRGEFIVIKEDRKLFNLKSSVKFKKFFDNVLGTGYTNQFSITMQINQESDSFDGRCFKIPTRFYILDICFQEYVIPPLDRLEIEFMKKYQALLVELALLLGKDIKVATCS